MFIHPRCHNISCFLQTAGRSIDEAISFTGYDPIESVPAVCLGIEKAYQCVLLLFTSGSVKFCVVKKELQAATSFMDDVWVM